MTNEEAIDILGRLFDTIENYEEYGDKGQTPLATSLETKVRINALSNGLLEAKEKVKEVYFGLGGEDVWSR